MTGDRDGRKNSETAGLSMGRESAVAVGAKVTLAFVGLLGFVFFAQTLGPAGIGAYYLVLAGAKFAVQAVGGTATAIKKRVAEVGVDVGPYLGLGLAVVVGFTAVLFVGVFFLEGIIEERLGPVRFAYAGAAIVGSLGLFNLTNRVYAGVGNPGAGFWVDTLRSVLTLGAQVALVVLGYGAMGLAGGLVAATLVSGVVAGILVGVRPRLPTRASVNRTISFAQWSVPNALLSDFYKRVDVLILGVVLGSTVVGYYEAALRVTVPAMFVAIGIGDSLVVKASGLSSLDQDVKVDLRNAMSYVGLFSVPTFVGALALPPESLLVYLLREDFGPAWPALIGLALFQIFNAYRMPFESVINGIDRPELQFRVSLLTTVIHLPLVYYGAITYELVGVVGATVVAEALRVVAYQFLARSVFGRVVLTQPMVEQWASAVVMGAVVWVVGRSVAPVGGWVELGGLLALGAGTYFGLLLVVSGHFRATTRSVAAEFGVS